AMAAGDGRRRGQAVAGGEHGLRGGLASGAEPGARGVGSAAIASSAERTADEVEGGVHRAGAAGRPVGPSVRGPGRGTLRPQRTDPDGPIDPTASPSAGNTAEKRSVDTNALPVW